MHSAGGLTCTCAAAGAAQPPGRTSWLAPAAEAPTPRARRVGSSSSSKSSLLLPAPPPSSWSACANVPRWPQVSASAARAHGCASGLYHTRRVRVGRARTAVDDDWRTAGRLCRSALDRADPSFASHLVRCLRHGAGGLAGDGGFEREALAVLRRLYRRAASRWGRCSRHRRRGALLARFLRSVNCDLAVRGANDRGGKQIHYTDKHAL